MPRGSVRAVAVALLMSLISFISAATTTTITSTTTISSTTTITPLVTSTILATASATIISTEPTAASTMAYSGEAFQSAVLNSTNYHRRHYEADAVTWNSTLADFAQSYAQKCLWQHSNGPYGENLAENFDSPALAIDKWAAEESKYNYAKPKFSEATGHFTQLVWKNTTSVGCGAVQCNNNDASNGAHGWYVVCEYSPRGNIDTFFASMVGKAGESKDGTLGFGSGAATLKGGGWKMGALLVVSVGLAMVL